MGTMWQSVLYVNHLRVVLAKSLPQGLKKKVQDYVLAMRGPNLVSVVADTLTEEEKARFEQMRGRLKQLQEYRNDFLHEGAVELDRKRCLEWTTVARELLSLRSDSRLFSATLEEDPARKFPLKTDPLFPPMLTQAL